MEGQVHSRSKLARGEIASERWVKREFHVTAVDHAKVWQRSRGLGNVICPPRHICERLLVRKSQLLPGKASNSHVSNTQPQGIRGRFVLVRQRFPEA